MPIDHFCISLPSSTFQPTLTFLASSLSSLSLVEIPGPVPNLVGIGKNGSIDIWFTSVEGEVEDYKKVLKGMHVAFSAENGEQVRKFHEAALKAGGIDNGAPGLRFYHPKYYGAFVFDPVFGINFEVVCHQGDI